MGVRPNLHTHTTLDRLIHRATGCLTLARSWLVCLRAANQPNVEDAGTLRRGAWEFGDPWVSPELGSSILLVCLFLGVNRSSARAPIYESHQPTYHLIHSVVRIPYCDTSTEYQGSLYTMR